MNTPAVTRLTRSVERRQSFATFGHATGTVTHNCMRGLSSAELLAYPELKGLTFVFTWDAAAKKVSNARFAPLADLRELYGSK